MAACSSPAARRARGSSTARGAAGCSPSTTLTTATPTFVNDVTLARGRRVLHRLRAAVPLPGRPEAELTGISDRGQQRNGIEPTRDGQALIVVQSNVGKLFKVDPRTGAAREIVLDQPVVNGDGLLLDGRILYVVQNRDNKVAVVKLSHRLKSGRVLMHLTDPDFDVPSTIDEFGKRLYAVNARFTTPATPDTPYWLAQFRKIRGR